MQLWRKAKRIFFGEHAEHKPAFPFFVPVPERTLSKRERDTVEKLLVLSGRKTTASRDLVVVGRCGCERCPIVFFQSHEPGDGECELVTAAGIDSSGGLVAVVLLEKQGRLSQLDSYSVDGHYPWSLPPVQSLALYTYSHRRAA